MKRRKLQENWRLRIRYIPYENKSRKKSIDCISISETPLEDRIFHTILFAKNTLHSTFQP